MHAAVTAMFGVSDQTGRTLVSAGALRNPVSLARAQVSTRVTALGADGLTYAEYLADAPRFTGALQGLLIEGQRTNGIRNPRAEGAVPGVIGSGGMAPAHMSWAPGATQSAEIIGVATLNGLPALDIEFRSTGTGSGTFSFELVSGVTLAPGSTHVGSVIAQLVSGNLAAASIAGLRVRVDAATALNGAVANMRSMTGTERFVTLVSTGADAAAGRLQFVWNTTSASTVRLRFAAPQLGLGTFASTPILPAAGTPAASTRGADFATALLSSLGIGGNGACTILGTFMMPQLASGNQSQEVFDLDAGSTGHRFSLRLPGGGGTGIALLPVLAGVDGPSATIGSISAGVPFRIGMAIDGTGRAAASLDGAAAVATTGGPTSGLTTLRLGNNAANSAPMFGETRLLRVLPYALSDATLTGAVAALPG